MKPLILKTHHFHSKLLCHKPMLRQIEWRLQNGPITNNGVLPVTTLFFEKCCFSKELLIKIWFEIPTTQMFKLILFISAVVLFEGVFSLWLSLKKPYVLTHWSYYRRKNLLGIKGICPSAICIFFSKEFEKETPVLHGLYSLVYPHK